MQPEYLDYAATTPVHPEVLEAMLPYFTDKFGNPSSDHFYGREAALALRKARAGIADVLDVAPSEITFTSGATESINLALQGFYRANKFKGRHIITVQTEHKAVLKTCEYLEEIGAEVSYLGVDCNGLISLDDFEKTFRSDTILVAIMHVNNETGVMQDMENIGRICKARGVPFFCDITQSFAKLEVELDQWNVSMAAASSHKIQGPKGCGILYKKNHIDILPLIHGGGQEGGLRAGTENMPAIVGFAKAAFLSAEKRASAIAEARLKFDEAVAKITQVCPVRRIGLAETQSPFIVPLELQGMSSADFFAKTQREFALSNGSACNASTITGSHVMEAMGRAAYKLIRIS